MPNTQNPAGPHPAWRKLWKPAVVTGASGTAIVVWLDEIVMYAEEILGLILLPIMAGAIFLLDILMFRSRMPRQEDLEQSDKPRKER